MESKKAIRDGISEIRDGISEEDRAYLNGRIFSRITSLPEFDEAGTVLTYVSYRSEADTYGIIRELISRGKGAAVPKVCGNDMEFYLIKGMEDLEEGYRGIPEPRTGCSLYEPSGRDLILVPGIVFDTRLFRIGYGKGFYDRYLSAHSRIRTAGVAYDVQIVDAIPVDAWDRSLDMVVTDKRILRF